MAVPYRSHSHILSSYRAYSYKYDPSNAGNWSEIHTFLGLLLKGIILLLPYLKGPTLIRSHLSIIWIWFSYVILLTLSDHSGYHLPGVPSPEAHDFHHLKTTQFFGLLGLLDYLRESLKLV